MKRTLLLLSLALPACGTTMAPARATAPAANVRLPHGEEASAMQMPGDFATYRISGSYREAPVTLTQRVLARRSGVLLLDLTIDDGGSTERLRLRVDDGARRGELLSVAKVEGGVLRPYGVMAYEQRMSELVPAADDNEGEIGKTGDVVQVSGVTPIRCIRTEYRVRMGAHHGVMSTLSAQGFPWDNLGGKMVADDGTVIYQAQLVELGNQQPPQLPSGSAMAATSEELYDFLDE